MALTGAPICYYGGSIPAGPRREAREEAGIATDRSFIRLDSTSTIPAPHVCGFLWGETTLVIPEYCFGVQVPNKRMSLSEEHIESRWASLSTLTAKAAVLVCIARRSASYATYQGPGAFAVNVLSDAQRDLSDAGLHRPDLRLPLDSGQK